MSGFNCFVCDRGMKPNLWKYGGGSHGSNVKYKITVKVRCEDPRGGRNEPETVLLGLFKSTKWMLEQSGHTLGVVKQGETDGRQVQGKDGESLEEQDLKGCAYNLIWTDSGTMR